MLHWYQCDIVTRDYSVIFWCRFLSSSIKEAKYLSHSAFYHTSSKSYLGKIISKKDVEKLLIFKIPKVVLNRYDLNRMSEIESFLLKERG